MQPYCWHKCRCFLCFVQSLQDGFSGISWLSMVSKPGIYQLHGSKAKTHARLCLGGVCFNIFWIFNPKIGEDEPILTHIFLQGVETQPPTIGVFYEEGDTMFGLFFAPAGTYYPAHRHEPWEIYHVLEGDGHFFVGDDGGAPAPPLDLDWNLSLCRPCRGVLVLFGYIILINRTVCRLWSVLLWFSGVG